jgi:hypothetical protein
MDLKAARIKKKIQIAELEEWREKAYHSAKLYKERTKRWHDKRVKTKQFKLKDKVLLFNSRIHLFGHGKLCSMWEGSRPSNSSREIRYFSLTLTFIYLVMASFVVSGKAPTLYCMLWITVQSPSNAMMAIHSRQMANALNYSLSQTPRISRKWMPSISSSYNDYIHKFMWPK